MDTWTVSCGACGHAWARPGRWSVYERQAIESRPCPKCGALTLKSPEPAPAKRGRGKIAPRRLERTR